MTNIAVALGALVALGLFARTYTWRIKAAVLAVIIVMIIILIR
jgi:hypothetical protein